MIEWVYNFLLDGSFCAYFLRIPFTVDGSIVFWSLWVLGDGEWDVDGLLRVLCVDNPL
jgi:hypothetical protein